MPKTTSFHSKDYRKTIDQKYSKWKDELEHYNDHILSVNSSAWTSGPIYNNISISDTTGPATLKVDGTLEVNGRDIVKELDEMRDALLLLKRDVDMEEKYPKLKELKDAYEAQLEKYKTFEALK